MSYDPARSDDYGTGYREGFRQAERLIANWLQWDGHGAISNAIAMGKHRAMPNLTALAEHEGRLTPEPGL